jgi:glycosyltransferase involved in cell wall biosynthesis
MEMWLKETATLSIEVLIIDDASVDQTNVELQKIIRENQLKSIVFIQGEFGGPGPARNYGLEVSKGKWICFWDSDDLPVPREFMKMISIAEQKGTSIAVGGWTVFVEESYKLGKSTFKSETYFSPKFISIVSSPGLWRWAFRRELALRGRFPDLLMGEDQIYLCNLTLKSRYHHNANVYNYYVGNPRQLTQTHSALQARRKMSLYLTPLKLSQTHDLLKLALRYKIRIASVFHREFDV